MESKFTGGLWGLIGLRLGQFFLIVFTLTLGTPWAICFGKRWYIKHTVINGCQLEFDGKGIQLLGNFIKWFFLSLITIGIFVFWWGIKMEKWTVKHTRLSAPTAMIVG